MSSRGPPATDPGAEPHNQLLAVSVGGRRKAAVLMAALGPERAAEIMQHLQGEEIENLSLEMA